MNKNTVLSDEPEILAMRKGERSLFCLSYIGHVRCFYFHDTT